MTPVQVFLREWETIRPEHGSVLAGRSFEGDPASRTLAEELTGNDRIQILELAKGLEIRANSYVGKVRLGAIEVTVRPKLSGAPLLHLFRYAYGLRDLSLYNETTFSTSVGGFQDLLIRQLAAEAEELISRGLHRDYISLSENLPSPRGRIDFTCYMLTYVRAGTSLPCIHHPRSEDTLLNQVLLAGLILSARLATDTELRFKLMRLCARLRDSISVLELNPAAIRRAWWTIDRRTSAYEHAVKLIELLVDAVGASFSGNAMLEVSGFLFDMNRFFQALLSRFLRENLPGFELEDERQLKGAFAYDPQKNPLRLQAPTPRPDFVILRERKIVAVLDAKYRDLWERSLPASMLYQLAIYALCHSTTERSAAIIYPTLNAGAAEQSILVNDAVQGVGRAHVHLRPANLLLMEELLRARDGTEARRRRCQLARQLAFGPGSVDSDRARLSGRS